MLLRIIKALWWFWITIFPYLMMANGIYLGFSDSTFWAWVGGAAFIVGFVTAIEAIRERQERV